MAKRKLTTKNKVNPVKLPSARFNGVKLSRVRPIRGSKELKELKEPKEAAQKRIVRAKRAFLPKPPRPRLKVIGIGGGGGSIIAELAENLRGIDFMAVNTDQQALKVLPAKIRTFQLGQDLTRGLGTGMNAKIGEDAAEQAKEDIKKILSRVDFCILVACLGGGTGSGASPVFAEASREVGNVNLGIFTLPFSFEGEKRAKIAKEALKRLEQHLDGFVLLSNEKVFELIDKETSLQTTFSTINKILAAGLRGLIETIYLPGLINIDFADLKMILDFSPAPKKGTRARLLYLHSVLTGTESRAHDAIKEVFSNPLEDYDIHGADRILFNIAGPSDLKMAEVEKISSNICGLNRNARIIFGISRVPKLKDKLRLTVLATKAETEELKNRRTKEPKNQKTENREQRTENKEQKKEKPEPPEPPKPPTSSNFSKSSKLDRGPTSVSPTPPKPPKPPKPPTSSTSPKPSLAERPLAEEPPKENLEQEKKVRRSGLELKKVAEEMEKEIIRQEEMWETPAFLRKQKTNNQ